ncbi:hypothetical protein P154DRAFT_571714 [Amniculicola lignicola CBS 123094]|uniref:Uncharacterized protein n=1 Tax=Amniculicola lignicola CBS 123094 TaxID=1392246 RepID=A0A6A5WSY4_9PLEO|nr:hypothetical protein P154DRAFT_571714 [Amniculicola lignicola CBS 123094]
MDSPIYIRYSPFDAQIAMFPRAPPASAVPHRSALPPTPSAAWSQQSPVFLPERYACSPSPFHGQYTCGRNSSNTHRTDTLASSLNTQWSYDLNISSTHNPPLSLTAQYPYHTSTPHPTTSHGLASSLNGMDDHDPVVFPHPYARDTGFSSIRRSTDFPSSQNTPSHYAGGSAMPFLAQAPQMGWPTRRLPLRPGKVYYLPANSMIPSTSIVRLQRRPDGFFKHPVLLLSVDNGIANFYALTRIPPRAIADLFMCLRLGPSTILDSHAVASDPETLLLGPGSHAMQQETWVNLEERFQIEPEYLNYWSIDVFIDPSEFYKLENRITWLEAQQNRFIYKPLPRDLSQVPPGTIVMKPNPKGAKSTLGAPVVVVENKYPYFRYQRIKAVGGSPMFKKPFDPKFRHGRRECLFITRDLVVGHDGTPVMPLEPSSPDLREPSLVEIRLQPQWARLDHCKTWCYPHVTIQPQSVYLLCRYTEKLEQERMKSSGGWHKPPSSYHWDRKPLADMSDKRGGEMYASGVKAHKDGRGVQTTKANWSKKSRKEDLSVKVYEDNLVGDSPEGGQMCRSSEGDRMSAKTDGTNWSKKSQKDIWNFKILEGNLVDDDMKENQQGGRFEGNQLASVLGQNSAVDNHYY